jgi:hypothetical protein
MVGALIPIDRNSVSGRVDFTTRQKRSHLKSAITSNPSKSPLRKAKANRRASRMNTKQAAIGRWSEIFEYYGLPGITGKNHFKESVRYVVARANSGVTTRTAPGHSFVYVVPVMDGPC